MDVERPEVKVESQEVAGKRRVAHQVRHAEIHDYKEIIFDLSSCRILRLQSCAFCQQVAERRPQPQVLVPLQTCAASGFTSQPSVTSKMQQVQQRACALTASVKGAQTVVSTANQRRPDTQRAPPCVQMAKNLQPAPVQNGNEVPNFYTADFFFFSNCIFNWNRDK